MSVQTIAADGRLIYELEATDYIRETPLDRLIEKIAQLEARLEQLEQR